MELADLHMHSEFSPDTTNSTMMRNYECARAAGLTAIGCSDHHELDDEADYYYYMRVDYDKYTAAIDEVRAQANGVAIYKGLEIGYTPFLEPRIREWLAGKQFDYLIGSVHQLEHSFVTNSLPIQTEADLKKYYTMYFEYILASARSGLFSIIAHINFLRRFIPEQYRPFEPANDPDLKRLLESIFAEMIRRGTALEINVAALRHKLPFTTPEESVLALYAGCGGRLVSYASDAHTPEHVGGFREEVQALITKYNFTPYAPEKSS